MAKEKLPFFAFGNIAVGVIAVGNVAVGVVAIGFSVAIGPIAIGLNSLGWLVAIGLNAVGTVSLAGINGLGVVTFAGVNGLGALICHSSVNQGISLALAPVFATAEAIGFVLVRPKSAHAIPAVSLASLADGELAAGEVDARLIEVRPGEFALAQCGRRVPVELSETAMSAEDRESAGKVGALRSVRVRARVVSERRPADVDERGYRVAGSEQRVLVAQKIELEAGGGLAPIHAATLLIAAIVSAIAFVLGLARI